MSLTWITNLWVKFWGTLGIRPCPECGSWNRTEFKRQLNDLTLIPHEFHVVKFIKCLRCGQEDMISEEHQRH